MDAELARRASFRAVELRFQWDPRKAAANLRKRRDYEESAP
jgi:hypothetical protein